MQVDVFIAAYQEIEKKLYAFALKLTKNISDADDLLQETVIRAYRHRDQFRENTNFKAWISTIMRNTFINEYMRKRYINHTSLELFDGNLYGKNVIIVNTSESDMMMEELGKIIGGVDEKFRIPFLMHYEGYTYQEISEVFNIKLGTVKSRIHYARLQLRSMIQLHYQMIEA